MTIKMATWMHGNGAQPENAPLTQRRMAGSGLFGGADLSTNFFHFPITTPVIIDDQRPLLTRVFVLYRMKFCAVESVQLWSGRQRMTVFPVTQETGVSRDHPDIDRSEFVEGKTMFSMEAVYATPIEIHQGLSITVKVKFDSRESVQVGNQSQIVNRNMGAIEFFSAGVDWMQLATTPVKPPRTVPPFNP
jgi:hypothetical protein